MEHSTQFYCMIEQPRKFSTRRHTVLGQFHPTQLTFEDRVQICEMKLYKGSIPSFGALVMGPLVKWMYRTNFSNLLLLPQAPPLCIIAARTISKKLVNRACSWKAAGFGGKNRSLREV